MLNFHKISMSDRDSMTKLLAVNDFRSAEYSFANAFNWSEIFHVEVAFVENFMLMRVGTDKKSYLYPVGSGDLKTAVQWLKDDAALLQQPFVMHGVLPESKILLEQTFPDEFEFTSNRNIFDYLYRSEDLIHLTGKKYQPKRNHISRFKKTFDWTYETISPDNIQECIDMNEEWCRVYGCIENYSLRSETCVARRALCHFFDENLLGGLLRVDGQIAAYTVGERINSDTLIVHIEKAFSEKYLGVYQVINQEFVQRHAKNLLYVNREDDAGNEGLRKAKLSYHPAFLLEKYIAKAIK